MNMQFESDLPFYNAVYFNVTDISPAKVPLPIAEGTAGLIAEQAVPPALSFLTNIVFVMQRWSRTNEYIDELSDPVFDLQGKIATFNYRSRGLATSGDSVVEGRLLLANMQVC